MRKILLACIFIVLFAACTPAAAPVPTATVMPPAARVVLDKPDDRSNVFWDGESLTVEITSVSGIGRASLELTTPTRPKKVLLRFVIDGMESFRLVYGGVELQGSVNIKTGAVGAQSLRRDGGAEQPVAAGSPYSFSILRQYRVVNNPTTGIYLNQTQVAVELPADFLLGSETKFSVEWVDFYR